MLEVISIASISPGIMKQEVSYPLTTGSMSSVKEPKDSRPRGPGLEAIPGIKEVLLGDLTTPGIKEEANPLPREKAVILAIMFSFQNESRDVSRQNPGTLGKVYVSNRGIDRMILEKDGAR